MNNAHIIKIANMAQLVNVIAPIFTDEKRMFLQTIYYPLALFANNTKGQALDLLVKSPSYKRHDFDEVPHLDTSAALDGKNLGVNIVNRHRNEAVETEIHIEDREFAGPVEIFEVNAADIKAENSFETTTVKTVQRSAKAEKNLLRYSVPAHSYTVKATLA